MSDNVQEGPEERGPAVVIVLGRSFADVVQEHIRTSDGLNQFQQVGLSKAAGGNEMSDTQLWKPSETEPTFTTAENQIDVLT